ncbi:MAG: hypothetical protein JOY78_20205 [Pseudonocardia sp.]|nr:hypothetical protein [Pseudonocardia sp.]
MDDYREGDIFAENGDDLASQIKSSVYQAVARGDLFSSPYSLAADVLNLFGGLGMVVPGLGAGGSSGGIAEVIGIVEAIISGIVFLADQPNPHYSPYDITGGLNWTRGLLQAAQTKEPAA